MMIELTCPHCGHTFPALLVQSSGFCKCGMDFQLDPRLLRVVWTPDPTYTPGAARVIQKLERAEVH